ncbi:MAG TPA: HAMP domain-containing sensor histidine kinase [Terriglobales bacterium]|nr:HAMP domain-containing sensor histidine kinase [Terriglobales bacterium]
MKPRRSLRFRLLAGVLASQLVLAAGLVWAGIVFTRRQLERAFDAGLQGRLTSIAALVRYPESGGGLLFDASLLPPPRRRHPAMYQVRSQSGAVIANTFAPEIALPPLTSRTREPYWDFKVHGASYRGIRESGLPVMDAEEPGVAPAAKLDVYYAASTQDEHEEVMAAGAAIGATSLGLLLATLLLAGWIMRRELAPLRTLATDAAAISPRNWRLEAAPAQAQSSELLALTEALQRMLGRLHESHQQQRAFLANAAHHLKTPVAVVKSTLQGLLQRPREAAEYITGARAALQDVERLEQLLQRMLRLARLEQAIENESSVKPLAELEASCRAAIEHVQPLARARNVSLRGNGLGAGYALRADADDLELVWVNLLENAVLYSPAGGAVEIACEGAGAGVQVTVRDQGPGIPPDEAPFVFERFRRGSASPAGGFGLGLAIARAIVQAYGGAIAVVPQAAPGATLRVVLPLATAG